MVRAISVGLALLALLAIWDRQSASAGPKLDARTMKAVLRTATVEEEGFIDRAVNAALDGTLPPSVVDSSFEWAKRKPKHKFQYFKQAVLHQAAQQGVEIK